MTLGNAWLDIVRRIVDAGVPIDDPTGGYIELACVQFVANEFSENDPIVRQFIPERNIREMEKVFLTNKPNAFGHSYWSRISGPSGAANQLDRTVALLRKKPESRKAVITLGADEGADSVPCINAMHFFIRKGHLCLSYFSRGQDMWTKFCPDVLAIRKIQELVATRLGTLPAGPITGFTSSAHIYQRDLSAVKKALKLET